MANTKYKISFSLYTKGILYRVSPDTFSEHIDSPNIYNSEVLVVPMPKRSYINGSYLDINGGDNDENKQRDSTKNCVAYDEDYSLFGQCDG